MPTTYSSFDESSSKSDQAYLILIFLQCNVLNFASRHSFFLCFPLFSPCSFSSCPCRFCSLLVLRYASLPLGMVLPNNAKRSEISLWLQQRGQRSLFFTMPLSLYPSPLSSCSLPLAPPSCTLRRCCKTGNASSAKLQQWQELKLVAGSVIGAGAVAGAAAVAVAAAPVG